jgi:hypothetical protein
MSEDPAAAARQAGNLAATQARNALNGKPPEGRDGITKAIQVIERIRNTTGHLGPDDLLFLEGFYGSLGRDVYRIPDYLKNDDNWIAVTRTTYTTGEIVPTAIDPKSRTAMAATLVTGLLTLSDERRGGGFKLLPAEIRQDLRSTTWNYWNLPGGAKNEPRQAKGSTTSSRFCRTKTPRARSARAKNCHSSSPDRWPMIST